MKQITERQRYELKAYLQVGKSVDEIASLLGFHRSSIYRELSRNKWKKEDLYDPQYAQYRHDMRKEQRFRRKKFTPEMEQEARRLLTQYQLSPEQITGICKANHIPMVSHERLYQWIWSDKHTAGDLYMNLRRTDRKYRKRKNKTQNRGWIKDRVDISHRPSIVEKKKRFGDLEIDTIIGKNHSGAILTINDRSTGMLWTKKLPNKEAKYVTAATLQILMPYKTVIHTITADNGSEFAGHKIIARQLGIQFYFARPYHSWERGANENLNGLIRQYVPKETNIKFLSGKYLHHITHIINLRPRKRWKFLTPLQMVKMKLKKKQEHISKQIFFLSSHF